MSQGIANRRHDEILGAWVSVLGLVVLVLATVWWWLVFHQLIEADAMPLPQALPCLAANSDTCSLAQSLCARPHLFEIGRYSSEAFWIGLALLGTGPLLPAIRRHEG